MSDSDARPAVPTERRETPDRRRRPFHALLVGGLHPRRRAHRRDAESIPPLHDLHEAHWLAVAMLIMLLSVADAMLTLELMHLGAIEVNPVMALLLESGSPIFAYVKVALTAIGVTVLTVLARVHAFGRLPVGVVLYAVLGLYVSLIGYEYWLLQVMQRES
jgi:hypothetical protein